MPDKGNYREAGFLLPFSVSEGLGHHGGEGVIEFLLLTWRPNQEPGSFDRARSIYNLQGSLPVTVTNPGQQGHTPHKFHSLQNGAIGPGLRTQIMNP